MTDSPATPQEAIEQGILLMHLAEERERVEQAIVDQIAQVRKAGGTWRTVGVALGVTGQAAWERYGIHATSGRIPGELQLPIEGLEPQLQNQVVHKRKRRAKSTEQY